VPSYIELDELARLADIPDVRDDDILTAEILAASGYVAQYCGRDFTVPTEAETRKFFASSPGVCWVDDLASLVDLTVFTDDDDDGTAETEWAVDTDFYMAPVNRTVNGISGWPYTRVTPTSSRWFPVCRYRPGVHVTGWFGWAAIPEPVKKATAIQAMWQFKMKDAALGTAGFDQFGAVRVREHPAIPLLLEPYRIRTVAVA
jgi:hypothetical protein